MLNPYNKRYDVALGDCTVDVLHLIVEGDIQIIQNWYGVEAGTSNLGDDGRELHADSEYAVAIFKFKKV